MDTIIIEVGDLDVKFPYVADGVVIAGDDAEIEIVQLGEIVIPEVVGYAVGPKGDPGIIQYTPEFEEAREEAIAAAEAAEASKSAAGISETNAKTSETNSKASEIAAAQSVDDVVAAKTAAETARDTAVQAANDAGTSEQSALNAKTASETARDQAQMAKTAAETARDVAIQAKTDAITAIADIDSAVTAAETARDAAAGSATNAAASETAAAGSATSAGTSATAAATSASAASTDADDAELARAAAFLAQQDAEAARDAANLAQTAAETARDTVLTAVTVAETARDVAVSAKTAAETAKSAAEIAKTSAEGAQSNAESARDVAQQAAQDAQLAAGSIDFSVFILRDNNGLDFADVEQTRINLGAHPLMDVIEEQEAIDGLNNIERSWTAERVAAAARAHAFAALQPTIDTLAPIFSPEFDGVPTAPTADPSDNSVQIATTEYVTTAINELKGSAPAIYDTLGEIADWLQDNDTELLDAIATKFDKTGGTITGNVTITGTLNATGTITSATDITVSSDRKLKKNLKVIEKALDKVDALTGYTFDRVDILERQTGLIAQDVQKVLPEAVGENKYGLAVAYGQLAGLFVEAIKELRGELNALRAEIEAR